MGAENSIAVACCGSSLSSHQFQMLLEAGATEIVIAFDRQWQEEWDEEYKNIVRKLGFKINEFSIGFGPAIYKRTKRDGEIFAVRALPLGGYCAFEGEDEDGKDEIDEETAKNKAKEFFKNYEIKDRLETLIRFNQDSDEKIKVTSDDVVFWYNEIVGDPEFQSSGYNGQFISMPDGSQAHIDMEKIDDRTFVFRYPRIISEPLLHCNMDFGPRFIYEKAKKEGGVQGVKSICSIDMNPKELPSIGRNYLVEYFPGQRLVYKRNPHFWEKDINGVAVVYPEEMIVNIVSDRNTEFLLFNEGKLEGYSPRPEELTDVVNNSGKDYTVFNGGGSLGSGLWSFNQNPVNKDKPFYNWFTKKEFRQAMSCLLNRDRIISQAYRGMGVPNYYFFPEPNPFFNPEITLQYRFDLERATELLSKCGMTKKSDGWLYDQNNNLVEFDLTISGDDSLTQDIASIIADECSKVGVKVKIKTLDFQKVVEQLTATYDWQSVIIGLGVAIWPTQGSNVWPSDGNLHLWYPLQSSPATEWEAKIDELYDEGSCTLDKKKAQKIWDEYQSLILEQCPVIYLIRSQSFYAIRNRWDLTNMYFDNMGGANTNNLFLKEEL